MNMKANMQVRQIVVRLPEKIASRLETVIPRRKRNQFIVDRLSEAIEEHDSKLAKVAALVTAEEESDPELRQLAADWEVTVGDGIDQDNAFEK